MININDLLSNRIKEKNNLTNKLIISKEEIEINKQCSSYLRFEHGIDLDYKNEISISEGNKEIITNILLAFTNKDDYIISTMPTNNEINNIAKLIGCNIYEYNLKKFNKYLIDFEDIDEDILKKCKILFINYPNNPTGEVATKEFFKEVIKYAKKYNFIVINDASYIDFCFDEINKISLLNVDGGKEVGIEIYKIFEDIYESNYKISFIAGNKDIINYYNYIQEIISSKMILKKYNKEVISNYEKTNKELKEKCLKEHELVKEVFKKQGFKIEIPKSGFYQYVNVPKNCNGVNFDSAKEFSLWLKENLDIETIPYDIEGGKYIRISISVLNNNKEEIIENLSKYKFEF